MFGKDTPLYQVAPLKWCHLLTSRILADAWPGEVVALWERGYSNLSGMSVIPLSANAI